MQPKLKAKDVGLADGICPDDHTPIPGRSYECSGCGRIVPEAKLLGYYMGKPIYEYSSLEYQLRAMLKRRQDIKREALNAETEFRKRIKNLTVKQKL